MSAPGQSVGGIWRAALRRRCGVCLVAGLVIASSGPANARDEMERGRDMAQRLCAACHMNPGQGEKRGPMDVPGFAAVARRSGQSVAGIVTWLRSIPPMMPNHHLTQDEMYALAVYIISLRDGS